MKRAFAALLLALPATGSIAADRDPLAGRMAGVPKRCVDSRMFTQGPQIVDPQTILYRDGARLWRTGPRGVCPSLRPGATLIVQIFGGQLCRNDRFQTLMPGDIIPSGSCLFTDFTPYDRAAAAAK